MFFVLVALPALAGLVSAAASGIETYRDAKDIERNKRQHKIDMLVSQQQLERLNETEDPDEIREIVVKGMRKRAAVKALKIQGQQRPQEANHG